MPPVDIRLPRASLFQVNPVAPEGYLVATDPVFTQKKQWPGTGYIQREMAYSPAVTSRRLGDGFYEQRRVREQLIQLTGQRYLPGYQSDEQQFRALMDAGITFARQFNLRPGIALSAGQMEQLISDIIWLVQRTVTLDDGTQIPVLTPQLYARLAAVPCWQGGK